MTQDKIQKTSTAGRIGGWQAAVNEQLQLNKESALRLTKLFEMIEGAELAKSTIEGLNHMIAILIKIIDKSPIEFYDAADDDSQPLAGVTK